MLEVDERSWVNCFKKFSNTESQLKLYQAKLEERPSYDRRKPFTCPIPPFKSPDLLKKIQMTGSVTCVLYYLEYLTLDCNVLEKRLHTELGCLFVRYISMIVKNEGAQANVDKLRHNSTINDLK